MSISRRSTRGRARCDSESAALGFPQHHEAQTYIEFSESPSRASHRLALPNADELRLEDRLRSLAIYSSDAWEMWRGTGVNRPNPRDGAPTPIRS